MKKYYGYMSILIVSNILYSMPGCQQIGNRLSMHNDAKNFSYVSCACPCNEYPALPKSQCSECKHYHLNGYQNIVILNPDIKEAHRLYKKEKS